MTEWDKRAIDSVRAGTPDVEAIYLAYREPMLRTAAGALRGVDSSTLGQSAEDIVGDVVVDLYNGSIILKPSDADHLRPLLRRIIKNKAVDLTRRRGAESRARAKQHPVDHTEIETDVETIMLAEQAEKSMHLLTQNEHYVVVENVKKDRRAKDVAAELGCTPQNISQLRKSALRKLGAELSNTDGDSHRQQRKRATEGREEGST
jgi:RNA polymerase sigma factor (sigma-70 family)